MSLRTRIALAAAAVAAVAVVLGAIGYFPTRAQLVDQSASSFSNVRHRT